MTETVQQDKYDKAIAFLTEEYNEANGVHKNTVIYDAWCNPAMHPAGCLFQFASKSGDRTTLKPQVDGAEGCLTMIRSSPEKGMLSRHVQGWLTDTRLMALEAEIRADERIPWQGMHIKLEHLPVFAEWQRRLDKELERCV